MTRAEAFGRFHRAVSVRIGPTFDEIERIESEHPWTVAPIHAALIAAFPAWCVLGAFVRRMKRP